MGERRVVRSVNSEWVGVRWATADNFAPPACCSDKLLCQADYLPHEFLHSWMRNFTTLVQIANEAFLPLTPTLIYHTVPIPEVENERLGLLKNHDVMRKLFVHQVIKPDVSDKSQAIIGKPKV